MAVIGHLLKKIPLLRQNVIFLCSILFCLGILYFRIQYSGQLTYTFMLWNLVLAVIPYGFSLFIYQKFRHHPGKYFYVLFVLLWLLFFPNAPYIITDLIHFDPEHNIPVWTDILIIFAFAWTGLILGFASLRLVHVVFENNFGNFSGWLFAISVIILGSFGVYIGRFLRLNSWDLFERPLFVFYSLKDNLLIPYQQMDSYVMTFFFSVFLFLAYLSIVFFMVPGKRD